MNGAKFLFQPHVTCQLGSHVVPCDLALRPGGSIAAGLRLRFLYVYLWQKGFLDGREAIISPGYNGFYEFLSVAKTYERKKQRRSA